jgi:hypothetical protein
MAKSLKDRLQAVHAESLSVLSDEKLLNELLAETLARGNQFRGQVVGEMVAACLLPETLRKRDEILKRLASKKA